MSNHSTEMTETFPLYSIKYKLKILWTVKFCPDNNTGSSRRI
jgi:hypothetical protein